jgi:phage tail-like protein
MDVNGTRYEMLLGRGDWARCQDDDGHSLEQLWQDAPPGAAAVVAWNASRHELTLRPDVLRFPAAPLDRPPTPEDRRGAGRDRFGSWYWITAAQTQLLVRSAGSGETTAFWPPAPRAARQPRSGAFAAIEPPAPVAPQRLAGAAVTDDHFLVVGTPEPAGLLVFDLQGGGAPSVLPWPVAKFAPADMAPRPGGGVLILEGTRLWELDRHFAVVGAATELAGSPLAVEAAPDGGALVLDRGDADGSLVRWYRDGVAGAPGRTADAALGLRVTGHDMALAAGTLFVADAGGNQAYAFALELAGGDVRLSLVPAYYPMRRFAGKGLVAAGGAVYYDFDDAWIPLADQPRARYAERAAVVTPVFDSDQPGCVWHRLMLDARVPGGTALTVRSQAADELEELAIRDWRPEPDPRPRADGCEVPFAADGPYGTHELLFQQAQGRYLRLRVELSGDGRATPRLRALRAWHPRFSYLERYLPKAYREDSESASFLDRFLANVEGFYTTIEDRLGAVQVLLSPDDAPADALDWLASWFDLTLDPVWDERRRRLLLANAMRFFSTRGTIRGVELALRLALDPHIAASAFAPVRAPALRGPRIVEAYRTRRTPGVVFGDPTDLGGPRDVVTTARWTPGQGRDALQAGWEAHLATQGLPARVFPLAEPAGALDRTWREFAHAVLGFVPARAADARWQAFLRRRYTSPVALAAAWGVPIDDFAAVTSPTHLPADGAALVDWFQFQSVALAMDAKAHRFTVLLPWPLHVSDSSGAELDQERLRALATRIVTLQQPAHTTATVKFFWAAFRIGEARLGDDTLLGSGSRVPEFVLPAVLGRGHLGEARLAGPVASDVVDRRTGSEETT